MSHRASPPAPTAELNAIVLSGVTVIVPFETIFPHPPVNVSVWFGGHPALLPVPPRRAADLLTQLPVTPVGNPTKVAPVAPVVV